MTDDNDNVLTVEVRVGSKRWLKTHITMTPQHVEDVGEHLAIAASLPWAADEFLRRAAEHAEKVRAGHARVSCNGVDEVLEPKSKVLP